MRFRRIVTGGSLLVSSSLIVYAITALSGISSICGIALGTIVGFVGGILFASGFFK